MDSSCSQWALFQVQCCTGTNTHAPNRNVFRRHLQKNTWNAHTHTHMSRGAYIRHKKKSALHSESPLIVPSHEISALAKRQPTKWRDKNKSHKHTQTLTHPPTHTPAKFQFGQGSVSLPKSHALPLYRCKDSLVLVIGAWWARRHEGADVKLCFSPLLHNPCFIGPIPCGVMRPIKSVPH